MENQDLRIMVSYLEVNQKLFLNIYIYIKLHGAGIMPLQNTFQNLIHSQTQHFADSGMLH